VKYILKFGSVGKKYPMSNESVLRAIYSGLALIEKLSNATTPKTKAIKKKVSVFILTSLSRVEEVPNLSFSTLF